MSPLFHSPLLFPPPPSNIPPESLCRSLVCRGILPPVCSRNESDSHFALSSRICSICPAPLSPPKSRMIRIHLTILLKLVLTHLYPYDRNTGPPRGANSCQYPRSHSPPSVQSSPFWRICKNANIATYPQGYPQK